MPGLPGSARPTADSGAVWAEVRGVVGATAPARRGAPDDEDLEDAAAPPTVAEPTLTTVRDRHTAAGLSAERIEQHMTAGRVRVDGDLVTDLNTLAPAGTRVVVWGT